MRQESTPAQRLWAEVFGRPGEETPALDSEKVLAIVDSLFDSRERMVVRLRFGFEGPPLAMDDIGKRLPRVDGTLGVSRETARRVLAAALRHLRRRRSAWEEMRLK